MEFSHWFSSDGFEITHRIRSATYFWAVYQRDQHDAGPDINENSGASILRIALSGVMFVAMILVALVVFKKFFRKRRYSR